MSEEILKIVKAQTFVEPQIVGNIAMVGLVNEKAQEKSPVISLREALRTKKITITEGPGGYEELKTKAEIPTLVRSSEAISKAGKQDRVVKQSSVVSGSRILDVYCIEHGRWGEGAKPEWEPINLPVPIRRAVLEGRSQSDIWSMISEYLHEWQVKSRTDALSAIFDALGQRFEKFVANFEWWENQIGMIICINGKPSGLELFSAKDMFRYDGMHILRDSYVPEALRGEKVPMLPGDVSRTLTTFFDELQENKRKVDIVRHNGEVVYATVI